MANEVFQSLDAAIADLKKPYSAPSQTEPPQAKNHIFYCLTYWDYELRFKQAHEKTGLNLLLFQFALRAYEAQHGAPPQSLNQLAPAYLKAIPRDAFADDAPFHYLRAGKSYKLWSVGPDGKDDGGAPIPRETPLLKGQIWRPIPIKADSKGDWLAAQNS